jgi:hypothetical protein
MMPQISTTSEYLIAPPFPSPKTDGTPSPRVAVANQHKLLVAMHKYKSNYESAKSKETELRQPLEMSTNALVR